MCQEREDVFGVWIVQSQAPSPSWGMVIVTDGHRRRRHEKFLGMSKVRGKQGEVVVDGG